MKLYITGPAWSWKSTLAQKLGEHFNVPVIHLDDLLWNADWTENENYWKLQKEAIAKSDWIIEWPSCSIVKSMDSVDRIIILDYPPIGNAFRMTKRYLKAKILGEGRIGMKLPEKFNPSLILRTFIWRKRQFPRLLENIPVAKRNKSVTILRSPKFALETIVRSIGG